MIFWDVDTQADFVHPGGKLYVPGAETIIPNLARLTRWAGDNKVLVVASACAHREGDREFQIYPPHCLAGTPGQQKIPETLLPRRTVIPNRPVDSLPDMRSVQQVIVEKQQLDVFTNPNTEELLARLGKEHEIILYGVVTEICVACAARGLLEHGYPLRLVSDAVRHLDANQSRALLDEVAARGAALVTTDEVVRFAA